MIQNIVIHSIKVGRKIYRFYSALYFSIILIFMLSHVQNKAALPIKEVVHPKNSVNIYSSSCCLETLYECLFSET